VAILKVIKITLPRNLQDVEIRIFADLHIGDKHCNLEAIKAEIEYVRTTPNCYAILNGDILNNATKTSVSDSYAELLSPMEQIATYIELFTPIKDKILIMTQGNHENRTYNKEGVDLTLFVAQQLGIEDRYSKTGAVLFLKLGEHKLHNAKRVPLVYSFYVIHGSGGGRKEGAKAIRLADMASIIDVDIYLHAHTHLPMVMREGFYRTDLSNGVVKFVDKLFVNTSAQLHYGGYGEAFEFKPSSTTCPIIYLSGTSKFAQATL
jgi:predicted phosphodiesterase